MVCWTTAYIHVDGVDLAFDSIDHRFFLDELEAGEGKTTVRRYQKRPGSLNLNATSVVIFPQRTRRNHFQVPTRRSHHDPKRIQPTQTQWRIRHIISCQPVSKDEIVSIRPSNRADRGRRRRHDGRNVARAGLQVHVEIQERAPDRRGRRGEEGGDVRRQE